jgi:hypothetical protein
MKQQLLFVLRQSPDWHGLAADFKQGREIDPVRFRPPGFVPGFGRNLVDTIGLWNSHMAVDFFSCRARLKDMSDDSISKISNARRISYLDVENFGPEIKDYVVFYHDDDDWFAPDMAQTLEEVLPENYDVCVFPQILISTNSFTMARARPPEKPQIVIGRHIIFSHRYQTNNYGLNGRVCDSEALLGMKDHVYASEYANEHGLRDVYIDRIISATTKTPCSARGLSEVFREPEKAAGRIHAYVDGLKAVKIPENMGWIADRVESLIELFSAAAPRAPAARPGAIARLGVKVAKPFQPALVGKAAGIVAPAPAPAPARVKPVAPAPGETQLHSGVRYLEFMKFVAEQKAPSSYFEIGTRTGTSLAQIECDAICVDPNFLITTNVIKKRRRSLLYQMPSDEFFATCDVKQVFSQGIDLAFLDGLHLFEFLLRDFMNTEKSCHKDSVILLHDCLPFNNAITGRVQTPGAWTGDVWKVLPILKKFRPDLTVALFDCPPTGLVAITNLNPGSTVLSEAYDQIIAEFSPVMELPSDLRSMYPLVDTKALVAHPEKLGAILPVSGAAARAAAPGAVSAGH